MQFSYEKFSFIWSYSEFHAGNIVTDDHQQLNKSTISKIIQAACLLINLEQIASSFE